MENKQKKQAGKQAELLDSCELADLNISNLLARDRCNEASKKVLLEVFN